MAGDPLQGVLIVILLLQAAAPMLSARLPVPLTQSVAACLSGGSLTLLIPAALGIASILLLLLVPAADIWVAVAGPLTHIPMIVFWLLMLLVATWVAYRTTHIKLNWPNPLTTETLGIAVCVGAVVVSRCWPANSSRSAPQQPGLSMTSVELQLCKVKLHLCFT